MSLQSSVRVGGALTVSVFDVDVDGTSASGMVSVGASVLLWVWVARSSEVDVTITLREASEFTGVYLTSTSHDKQSAVLLQAPDI